MKNLAKFALLGFVALLFSACSTTTYSAELILDTEPQQAEIICDGKSLGHSPISYNVQSGKGFFFDEKFIKETKEKYKGNIRLPSCKARWVSGYEDYFPMQTNLNELVSAGNKQDQHYNTIKQYRITKTLKRSKDKNYNIDFLYAQRYNRLKNFNANNLNLRTNPAGAQIYCDNNAYNRQEALRTGIVEIQRCKAVFISGYEQNFRHRINIDKEDPSVLLNQTINRPNTAGYADDMRWALELEKKQILEANERARTQAAQAAAVAAQRQAAAAQAQAQAAQQQAQAAQQQAQAAQQQATMQMLSQPSALDRTIQRGNEMLKNQSLDGINKSLKSIDRTLKGQPNYGLGGLQ